MGARATSGVSRNAVLSTDDFETETTLPKNTEKKVGPQFTKQYTILHFLSSLVEQHCGDVQNSKEEIIQTEDINKNFWVQFTAKDQLDPDPLDRRLAALEELFNLGFVQNNEYELRRGILMCAKSHWESSLATELFNPSHFENLVQPSLRINENPEDNRNVRVFISSTFQDMASEREQLLKNIFPQLQKFCRERDVSLTQVDLRWGITSEESSRGDTINICLNEVDKCRPYFVSMLGHRYGWAQPTTTKEDEEKDQLLKKTFDKAVKDYPWLNDHRFKSITELEIRHAVLNHPFGVSVEKAKFYFKIPENGKSDDNPKLTSLKEEINNFGSLDLKHYKTPEQLGEYLFNDLKNLIDIDYPVASVPTPFEKEQLAHKRFQKSRALFVGRKESLERISHHMTSNKGHPLVITGKSGIGKTSLLANWAACRSVTHPDTLTVAYYVGATALTEATHVLLFIMQEFNIFWKLGKNIPKDKKEILQKFPDFLNAAESRGGCVIIIDGLDQLSERDDAHQLGWLPVQFPPNIHVVCSTSPHSCIIPISDRAWPQITLQNLNTPEKEMLVQKYMSQYSKQLTQPQIEILVKGVGCGNPLFLRTVLEEIRVFGIFENLTEMIKNYVNAENRKKLFQMIFDRLEREFEKTKKGCIGDLLSLLSLSRQGLTEPELLALLDLPFPLWSSLHLALGDYILDHSALLHFFHTSMKKAILNKYLGDSQKMISYRKRIATYFWNMANSRAVEEVPYQLENCGDWSELMKFVTNVENFKLLYEERKFDLYRYWESIQQNGNLDPSTTLLNNIISTSVSQEVSSTIQLYITAGQFFREIAAYGVATELYVKSLSLVDQHFDKFDNIKALVLEGLAYVYRMTGEYQRSVELYIQALDIRENTGHSDDPKLPYVMNNLADLYRLQGKYEAAKQLYLTALEKRKKIFGSIHEDIAESFDSLGLLYQDMGDYPTSEKYFHETIKQRELLLSPKSPEVAVSYYNLGGLYLDWSKFDLVGPAYFKSIKIYFDIYGAYHPYVGKVLNSLAALYQEQGKYETAEILYDQTILIRKKVLRKHHPDYGHTLNDLAVLYCRQRRTDKAEPLYQKALKIRAKALGTDHPDYAQTLKNLGSLYQEMKNYDKALAAFEQARNIAVKAFGERHMDVAAATILVADIYQIIQKYDEGVKLYLEALQIFEELLGPNHSDIALALNNLAILYYKKKDITQAEETYIKALKVYTNVFGKFHPDVGHCILNIAQFYRSTGRKKEALDYFKESCFVLHRACGEDNDKYKNAKHQMEELELS